MKSQNVTMLGTGLIGMFYTMTLHSQRGRDRVTMVYSRSEERVRQFAKDWNIPRWTTDLKEAIEDADTDTVVIGLPNNRHVECTRLAAAAGKAVLCTKPLARTAAEAKEMLDIVEKAGVFHGYLEDLTYTPKTLKAAESVPRDPPGAAQLVVLGQGAGRRRRHRRPRVSLHRDHANVCR
jgi:predicted dehydrogenase